jgi:hypothetical protein
MVRVAVVLCVVEPEVAVKVRVCVPVESCELTVTVAVGRMKKKFEARWS